MLLHYLLLSYVCTHSFRLMMLGRVGRQGGQSPRVGAAGGEPAGEARKHRGARTQS